MNELQKEALSKYLKLMKGFLLGTIKGCVFEKLFLEAFKNESCVFDSATYSTLSNVFYDLDDFCDDESIIDDGDINLLELKARVKSNYESLKR